jgi:hypothetical protein
MERELRTAREPTVAGQLVPLVTGAGELCCAEYPEPDELPVEPEEYPPELEEP